MFFGKFYHLFLEAILPGVRAIHASYPLQSEYFRKWMYGLDGYNKLGLLKDDFAPQYGEHTQEAIRRLPEQMQMERKYRSIRAIECELHHTILPPEQWTKMEDVSFLLHLNDIFVIPSEIKFNLKPFAKFKVHSRANITCKTKI